MIPRMGRHFPLNHVLIVSTDYPAVRTGNGDVFQIQKPQDLS